MWTNFRGDQIGTLGINLVWMKRPWIGSSGPPWLRSIWTATSFSNSWSQDRSIQRFTKSLDPCSAIRSSQVISIAMVFYEGQFLLKESLPQINLDPFYIKLIDMVQRLKIQGLDRISITGKVRRAGSKGFLPNLIDSGFLRNWCFPNRIAGEHGFAASPRIGSQEVPAYQTIAVLPESLQLGIRWQLGIRSS